MTDLFTENSPPVPLAPRRPESAPGESSEILQHVHRMASQQKTAGSLAQKIASAKATKTYPFALLHTVPGERIEVVVRKPSLMYLAMSGRLPAKLQAVVGKMFDDSDAADKIGQEIEDAAKQDFNLIYQLITSNAIEGFVDPRLVPEGVEAGPDELSVSEIAFEDLMEFFTWCNAGAEEQSAALAEFPVDEQAGSVVPESEGQEQQSATFRNPAIG
jgi:hypothetical protein